MQSENQKLIDLIRNIHRSSDSSFTYTVAKIFFESIEEFVRTDKQGEEVQVKDLASTVPLRVRGDLLRVLATYSVIASEKPTNTQCPNGAKNVN